MKYNWEEEHLSNILMLNVDSVDVLSQPEFHFAGVFCFANGLFEKGFLSGTETSYKTYNRLHKNQIVISKVKGWEGAIALVSEEFDGMFLSPVYPTFNLISEEKADIRFIDLFLKQKHVWQKLLDKSTGIGARRNSISESQFLNLTIPLPPLPEQQRIISIIENVKQKRVRIQQLRNEQEKEILSMRNSIFIDLEKKFESTLIGKILIPHEEIVTPNPDDSYKQVTVRMEHKGVFLRGMMKGSDIGSKQFLANEGDFIISKIDARNGAMGMIPAQLHGAIVTNDFPLYGFKEIVNPKYFYYFSNTFYFDDACKKASEGTTNRKRLKIDKFKNIQIPLPPIDEQDRIVDLLDKINEVKTKHSQTEKELTQILPSLLNKAFKGEL